MNFASIFKPHLKTTSDATTSSPGHIESSGLKRALKWSLVNTAIIAIYTFLDAVSISSGKINWHDVILTIKVAISSNLSMFLKEWGTTYKIKVESEINKTNVEGNT